MQDASSALTTTSTSDEGLTQYSKQSHERTHDFYTRRLTEYWDEHGTKLNAPTQVSAMDYPFQEVTWDGEFKPFFTTTPKGNDIFDKQEGGDHYKSLAIQPTEYIHKNELDWCEGNIVKYITRHKQKGGVKDLKKVIHYAELEMELVYGET